MNPPRDSDCITSADPIPNREDALSYQTLYLHVHMYVDRWMVLENGFNSSSCMISACSCQQSRMRLSSPIGRLPVALSDGCMAFTYSALLFSWGASDPKECFSPHVHHVGRSIIVFQPHAGRFRPVAYPTVVWEDRRRVVNSAADESEERKGPEDTKGIRYPIWCCCTPRQQGSRVARRDWRAAARCRAPSTCMCNSTLLQPRKGPMSPALTRRGQTARNACMQSRILMSTCLGRRLLVISGGQLLAETVEIDR